MADVVTTMVDEGVRQVTPFRSIEELLQSCGTSSQTDSLSPSSIILQNYGPLTCEGISGLLPKSVANAAASPGRYPQQDQTHLCSSHIGLELEDGDCAEATVHNPPKVDEKEAVPTSVASRCSPRSDDPQCECTEDEMTGPSMSQTDGKEGRKCSYSDVNTVSEQLLEESPIFEGGVDVAAFKEQTTAIMGRAATTSTSSTVSAHDTARQDEAGRFDSGVSDFVGSRFPGVPSTFIKSIYDVAEGTSDPAALDVEYGRALKPADGHCELGGISSPAGVAGEVPSGANPGGIWPLGAPATSNASNADFLMQCALRAMRAESSSIPAGVSHWGVDQRAVLEALLADVGGRPDCSTGDRESVSQAVHDQLFALRGAAGPATALQLLQAAATTRLRGIAPCDFPVGDGSQVCSQRESQFMMPILSDSGALRQSGMVGDNLPHMAGGQFPVPAEFNPRLTPSSPTELLSTRGLFDMENAVPRPPDFDSLLRSQLSQQLQSLCSVQAATYHGDFQAPLFTGLPQPSEFPVTRQVGGTTSDMSWLLPFSAEALGFRRSHVLGEGTMKKGRKGLGLSHDGKQKKIRRVKAGCEAQPDSSSPESPKQVLRRKRDVSRKSSNGSNPDVPSGLASSNVAASNGLPSFTDEDVAEAEAEAFLRQSNRSRNCPPEIITAVDFSGVPIMFTKVIGLHYHPKQNRWLAWRSQKGSKKVFKSFSTKKFGISGARLMALRWRLGHGMQTEDAQDGGSDSGAEEQIQSSSCDGTVQLPLDAALGFDDLSDSTATGGRGSSESSTPSNVRGQLSKTATHTTETFSVPVKFEEIGPGEERTQSPSASPIHSPVHKDQGEEPPANVLVGLECFSEAPSDSNFQARTGELLGTPAENDHSITLMSDRLRLLLGSVIPPGSALE